MSTFFDNSVDERFKRIYKCTTEKDTLMKIYQTDRNLFAPQIVDTIIRLGEQKEYTILTLQEFQVLLNSTIFRDYVAVTDPNSLLVYDQMFDVYFQAVCKDAGKQYSAIKNKILAFMRAKITVPSVQDTFTISNPAVHINTSYRPRDRHPVTASCDIANVIQEQFYRAVEEAKEEFFTFEASPSRVELSGPTLHNLLSNVLLLQETMLQESASVGVRVQPFIATVSLFVDA